MKKTFILLTVFCCAFLITACGSGSGSVKKNATVEELLDVYLDAFMNADEEKMVSVFPSFMEEDVRKYLGKDALEQQISSMKEEYGDDYKITYKINNTIKANESQLESVNNSLKKHYSNATAASECYGYEGTFTYAGSKGSEDGSLSEVIYCKFNDAWKLVIS